MTCPTDPPRPTGRPAEPVEITGRLLAWDGDQPIWVRMPDSPHRYMVLFETAEELRAFFARLGSTFTTIKRVDDGPEFVSSFLGTDVCLICDVRWTEAGRVRFVQVLIDPQ